MTATTNIRPQTQLRPPADDATLRGVLEAPVEALGYELLHLELAGRGSRILRIYIDAPGGIRVDDCEAVSRQLSAVLDVELDAAMPDAYHLEVSSPGLDRPLVKPEHFRRYVGQCARVMLNAPRDGRRRFTGELLEADANADGGVALNVDGERVQLAYDEMAAARLEPSF